MEDLTKIKENIEKSTADMLQEIEVCQEQLADLHNQMDSERRIFKAKTVELYKSRISMNDNEVKMSAQVNYHKEVSSKQLELETSILNVISLKDFERKVNANIRQIEEQTRFYSEEVLEVELAKRIGQVREKRVEYTNLVKDHDTLEKLILEQENQVPTEVVPAEVRSQSVDRTRSITPHSEDNTGDDGFKSPANPPNVELGSFSQLLRW